MSDSQAVDLAILGGGPAGYTAAIYAARAGLSNVLFEQAIAGGQITQTERIDNYPGLPGISGYELGEKLQAHSESLGTKVITTTVNKVEKRSDGLFEIKYDSNCLISKAVITAMGATPRAAGFKGEETFKGRGVSYCATCDGMFFRNKTVFVVGGGTAACEEALFLAGIAKEVIVLVRRDRFRAPKGVYEKLFDMPNINVRYQTSIERLEGDALPRRITLRNNQTGELTTEEFEPGSFGVFIFAGTEPHTELIDAYVEFGPDGGVLTDESMATKTPGLYAAGDIRSKQLRQVITAASDGAIAATSVYSYIQSLKMKH